MMERIPEFVEGIPEFVEGIPEFIGRIPELNQWKKYSHEGTILLVGRHPDALGENLDSHGKRF